MPKTAALQLLLKAYRDEIAWLMQKADEYTGNNRAVAADYLHRAHNLQAIIDGYERLEAKEAQSKPSA